MAPNLLGSTALFLAEATTTTTGSQQDTDTIKLRNKQEYASSSRVTTSTQNENVQHRNHYQWQIVWRNVLAFIYLHTFAIYGLVLIFTAAKFYTTLWMLLISWLAGMGITAGAHRLWAHRAYKANWKLRTLLCFLQTMAFQNHIYEWVRDHRVHHKFTDTDADPHNASRGFFFSHIGWLMLRKHPDVTNKGKTVDMSDLEQDPIVRFQRATYLVIMPLICFGFPTFVPWYFWNENIYISWYVAGVFRYTASLNGTWLVNSAAHIWGTKPYDKSITSTNNVSVAVVAFGEGWHNYHHVFPWDYKAAELGNYRLNFTTAFIDFFAWLGWAYDLKTVSVDMVKKRLARTGDGSHIWAPGKDNNSESGHHHHNDNNDIWGWGDKDMEEQDIKDAQIINKSND